MCLCFRVCEKHVYSSLRGSNEPVHKIGVIRESENRLVGLVKHSRYYLSYAVCVNSQDQRSIIDNGIRTKRAIFYVTKLNKLASCEDSDQLWHPTCILCAITKTSPCNILQLFTAVTNDNFQMKNCDIFLIIDRGYTLGSNEYPRSMF